MLCRKHPPTPVICTNLFLRKKDPACFICAPLLGDVEFIIGLLYSPSDSALIFFTGCIPRVHVLTSTCPHEDPAAQDSWSLMCCILYFTWAPKGLHQLHGACSCKCSYLPSTERWTAYRNFSFFSPYSFCSLFHTQLLDDTWNRIRGGVKNWSSSTLTPLTYLVSIPKAQHLETTPRNSMNRNKKILFLPSPIWQQN